MHVISGRSTAAHAQKSPKALGRSLRSIKTGGRAPIRNRLGQCLLNLCHKASPRPVEGSLLVLAQLKTKYSCCCVSCHRFCQVRERRTACHPVQTKYKISPSYQNIFKSQAATTPAAT